jgi:hypothetical protein
VKAGKPAEKIMLFNHKMTRASFIRMLDRRLALDAETRRARAAYHRAVAEQRAYARETHRFLTTLVAWLRVTETAAGLHGYGLRPEKKRRKATMAEMRLIVLKRNATRARNAKKKRR